MILIALALALLVPPYSTQQVGHLNDNSFVPLSVSTCDPSGTCTKAVNRITMDATWRWTHAHNTNESCFLPNNFAVPIHYPAWDIFQPSVNSWNKGLCSDKEKCVETCSLEGIQLPDWENVYGVSSLNDKDGLKLKYVTKSPGSTTVGTRLFMLSAADDAKYEMFELRNREFTVTVDVSNLPCGVNGALYFVEMEEDGGLSSTSVSSSSGNNKAGPAYGTGYCDAQCFRTYPFPGGQANTDDNEGSFRKWGSCCGEMDIWEANSVSTAFTTHPCVKPGYYRCENKECADEVCDKIGCTINALKDGGRKFYGRGPDFHLDTTKPMTVITRFITEDGTDDTQVKRIKRIYVQDGKVISGEAANHHHTLSEVGCKDAYGGMNEMSGALSRGMVLAMSVWDAKNDTTKSNMNWLDQCKDTPSDVTESSPDSYVIFSDMKIGPIGSTSPEVTLAVSKKRSNSYLLDFEDNRKKKKKN